MSFSDDILMAYADGELDPATRRVLEDAMARDAELAQRVAHYQNLSQGRRRLAAPRRGATVVQLAAVRATRAASVQAARKARKLQRWGWMEWSALVAVLVLGVAAGKFGLADWQPDAQTGAGLAWRDGWLLAQGRLALALDQAPSGATGVYGGAVRVVSSMPGPENTWCRSFTASGPQLMDMAGLACKGTAGWKVVVWQQYPRPQAPGRTPGMELPASVQAVVEQVSGGVLLDAQAEQDAMQKAWMR